MSATPTPGDGILTFSERLRIRKRTWWPAVTWHRALSPLALVHQVADMHRLRARHAPERRWQCCASWQRALSHKWNSREFAARHGCRVPALYWHGWRTGRVPFSTLPTHFVIRPSFGTATKGVHVMAGDRELLRDVTMSRSQLKARLAEQRWAIARRPLLVEEFVRTEDGRYALPIEYKFYTFGSTVAAIHVLDRNQPGVRYRFYTEDWKAFEDPMNLRRLAGDSLHPPACFDEMLAAARRLGAAYETFVRSDFYATDQGSVFGEFAATPHDGEYFTDFAQRYLGAWWARTMPERA